MTDGMGRTDFTGTRVCAVYRTPPPPITVVDMCQYGRLGIRGGLLQPAMTPRPAVIDTFGTVDEALRAGLQAIALSGTAQVGRCLVVRLSSWPAQAMAQLLQLEGALLVQAGIQRVVILSPFAFNNAVRQILICGAVRVPIRIVNARGPVMLLRRVVLGQGTLLQEGCDERLPHMPAMVLSAPERRVLRTTLLEVPIRQQALRRHRNHKTLYAQRNNALKKLRATGLAGLLRRFSAM